MAAKVLTVSSMCKCQVKYGHCSLHLEDKKVVKNAWNSRAYIDIMFVQRILAEQNINMASKKDCIRHCLLVITSMIKVLQQLQLVTAFVKCMRRMP